MARRKGEITAKMRERMFPYWVDIARPYGEAKPHDGYRSIGDQLAAMIAWHGERGLDHRRGGGGIEVHRWCFADGEAADAFARAFGGERRGRGDPSQDGYHVVVVPAGGPPLQLCDREPSRDVAYAVYQVAVANNPDSLVRLYNGERVLEQNRDG